MLVSQWHIILLYNYDNDIIININNNLSGSEEQSKKVLWVLAICHPLVRQAPCTTWASYMGNSKSSYFCEHLNDVQLFKKNPYKSIVLLS